mmetsp:Transcript_28245/g.55550  ORF Transcript_28245/g.55550 Transcript_28245/m.55550 type:complete len:818 (-) Transcript_28245:146-2599(-)
MFFMAAASNNDSKNEHTHKVSLWNAFNAIEAREEAELASQHKSYSLLKKLYAHIIENKKEDEVDLEVCAEEANDSRASARLSFLEVPATLKDQIATGPLKRVSSRGSSQRESISSILPPSLLRKDSTSAEVREALSSQMQEERQMKKKVQHVLSVKKVVEQTLALDLRSLNEGKDDRDPPSQFQVAPLPTLSANTAISLSFVTALLDHYRVGRVLSYHNANYLADTLIYYFAELPNVLYVPVPEGGTVTVVGDLHGQLNDLLEIFDKNGLPSSTSHYLFNGDIVDRGPNSCECLLVILAFKKLYPAFVHINRGNHEASDINSRDGFQAECEQKYDDELYYKFSELFATLPLATVISDKVFVCHGGLFWEDDTSLQDLKDFNRFHLIPPPETLMEDILWSDPGVLQGKYANPRGAGVEFGPDATAEWCQLYGYSMVVRSHECMANGYSLIHDNKLCTVFSASNYCRAYDNQGAVMVFDEQCNYKFVTWGPLYPEEAGEGGEGGSRQDAAVAGGGLTGTASLQQHVARKLAARITAHRVSLLGYWGQHSDSSSNNRRLISREVWCSGLQTVLEFPKIPFLSFATDLGLPEVGVDGAVGGPVDFVQYLSQFRVSHKVFGGAGNETDLVSKGLEETEQKVPNQQEQQPDPCSPTGSSSSSSSSTSSTSSPSSSSSTLSKSVLNAAVSDTSVCREGASPLSLFCGAELDKFAYHTDFTNPYKIYKKRRANDGTGEDPEETDEAEYYYTSKPCEIDVSNFSDVLCNLDDEQLETCELDPAAEYVLFVRQMHDVMPDKFKFRKKKTSQSGRPPGSHTCRTAHQS